jgi:pyrroloquinoline quinone biosynthesis protein B
MRLHVLGVAAGGGFPQWNCACDLCARCRRDEGPTPTSHAGIAVRGDDGSHCLANATPDVHAQIEATPELWPTRAAAGAPLPARGTPIASVVLTDAEFDHTIGLLLLREGAALDVWGTPAVLEILAEDFPVRRLVDRYAEFRWRELTPGKPARVVPGVDVTPFVISDRTPRFAARPEAPGAVVALRFDDPATGGSALWAPQVPAWTDEVRDAVAAVDVAFVDGTFWNADELIRTGAGTLAAPAMGHLPVGGHGGIAQELSATGTRQPPRPRRYLAHINNTNPILDPRSPQRAHLGVRGIEIAPSGTSLDL